MDMKAKLWLGYLVFAVVESYAQRINSGKYFVGYQTIIGYDWSRPYHTGSPRMLPIHVWYPTRKTANSKPILFKDLVEADKNYLWEHKNAKTILKEAIEAYVDSTKIHGIVDKLIDYPTKSYQNLPPIRQKSPLVIINSGLNSTGFVQHILAEYLVKNGFVVVAYPSLPEKAGHVFEFNQKGIHNQLADLELVARTTQKLPFVNPTKMYLVGWSIGGATQIIYQMKEKKAFKIISLDAASQYEYGWNLIENNINFENKPFKTPFLQIVAGASPRYKVPRSAVFFDSLAVIKKQIKFTNSTHSKMLSIVNLIENTDEKRNDLTDFESICEEVLKFILE